MMGRLAVLILVQLSVLDVPVMAVESLMIAPVVLNVIGAPEVPLEGIENELEGDHPWCHQHQQH